MTEEQEPELEVKRRLAEQKRDQLRAQGFDSMLEALSLNAQKVDGGVQERERVKAVQDLKGKAENCYLGAKALDELLKSLPEPEKKEG